MSDIVERLTEASARFKRRTNENGVYAPFLVVKDDDVLMAQYRLAEAADRISSDAATIEKLREALTPSGETKAAYIGEFHFTVDDWDPNGGEDGEGEDILRRVTVPWTTIKEIMAAIEARAALATGAKT